MSYEYALKGVIHAGMLNPWKVNKDGIFEDATKELNDMAEKGWEVITAYSAGNNDRAVFVMRRKN
jgi:hypothetical protein